MNDPGTCDMCDKPFTGRCAFLHDSNELICESCYTRRFPGKRLLPTPAGSGQPTLLMSAAQYQFVVPPKGKISRESRRKTSKKNSIAF